MRYILLMVAFMLILFTFSACRYRLLPEATAETPNLEAPAIEITMYYHPPESSETPEIPQTPQETIICADGGIIGLIADSAALLRQGVNTLFPCQLVYVYIETAVAFVTVGRGSDKYQLITNAGGISVSTRLAPHMLVVTPDWVVRRNPGVIVKFTDVLGSNATTPTAAIEVKSQITNREGWRYIEAVQTDSILLLSPEMMEHDETRLAATILIARFMYPELFEEVDVSGMVAGLMQGMDGVHFLQ